MRRIRRPIGCGRSAPSRFSGCRQADRSPAMRRSSAAWFLEVISSACAGRSAKALTRAPRQIPPKPREGAVDGRFTAHLERQRANSLWAFMGRWKGESRGADRLPTSYPPPSLSGVRPVQTSEAKAVSSSHSKMWDVRTDGRVIGTGNWGAEPCSAPDESHLIRRERWLARC
jgi:hypothetical protein